MGNVCLMNMTQVALILLDNLPMANAYLMNINRETFFIVRPIHLRKGTVCANRDRWAIYHHAGHPDFAC